MSDSNLSGKPVIHAVDEFLAFLLSEHLNISKILVALSGGKDSVCLLTALANQNSKYQLKAVYIDHGLQSGSRKWREFNKQLCAALDIEFLSQQVQIDSTKASLEQEARNARYSALASLMDETTCLVTAQHLDDQAETVLLQLLRGAGTKGLSAMPYCKTFANGIHARPLLKTAQSCVESYISESKLNYIEDPSNQDESIRRNFLRHTIIPALEQHWPQVNKLLGKVSDNQSETQMILDELAQGDLQICENGNCLLISELKTLSASRQNNLLRYWLASFGIRMPARTFLSEIKQQLLLAEEGAEPVLELAEFQLRRYRNNLYCVPAKNLEVNNEQQWLWSLDRNFDAIPGQIIQYEQVLKLWPELIGQKVLVRYRQAGDKFYSPKKEHSQSIKNYFQEKATPNWLRDSALLVVHQDKVIFIQEKIS